jgi:hypothetical protein
MGMTRQTVTARERSGVPDYVFFCVFCVLEALALYVAIAFPSLEF